MQEAEEISSRELERAFRLVPEMPVKYRRLGFVLAVVSFFYFAAFLGQYAFPHDWNTALTAAAGGHPFLPLQRPLWQSVALLTGQLSGQSPLLAMNLLSTALSALAVWLMYRVAYYWRRRPSLRFVLSEEDIGIMAQSRLWAAIFTGMCVMTSAPVFAAATTGHPNALDAALFAGVLWMSVRFRETEFLRYAIGAGLMLGFGVMEHPLFLLMMPFILIWWALLVRGAEPGRRMSAGLNFLFWLLPGLCWGVVFCFIYSALPSATPTGLTDPLHVIWQFLAYYNRMFTQVIGQAGWLLIVLTAYLPAVYLQAAGFQPSEGAEHSAGQWFMRSVLALLAILLLFNLPGTPASVSTLLGLNLPYLITALWIGQLLAFLLAFICTYLPGSGRTDKNKKPFKLAAVFVLLCFAGAGVLTAYRYNPRQGEPLRDVARSMLEAMGPRNYLVTVGYMDDLLFWEARSRGQDVSLIQLRYAQNPLYRSYLVDKLLGLSVRFSEPPSMDRIFKERFGTVTNLYDVLAVEHRPEWWTGSGFDWFPAAGIYSGVPPDADWVKLMESIEARQALNLLKEQKTALQPRRLYHSSLEPSLQILRHRLSVLANNLGYRYAEAGMTDQAGQAFEIALNYNLDNLSAMLNRIPLLARSGRKLEADLLEEQTRRRLNRETEVDRDVLAKTYGHVVDDPAWIGQSDWWPFSAPTSPPPATVSGPAIVTNNVAEVLKKIQDALRDTSTRGPAALTLLAMGQDLKHKDMMQTAISILAGLPDFAPGQRALYSFAMRQGDIETAQGLLEQMHRLNPDDREIRRMRIEFARRHSDRSRLMDLIKEALELDRNDVLANYLVSENLALTGRFDQAEAALLNIQPERRDALIHTGLALHVWKQGRHADALAWIDKAIAQAPQGTHPEGVKGMILADAGEWEAALPLLEAATGNLPADRPALARLYLAKTYVHMKQPERARPLLKAFRDVNLDVESNALLLELRRELEP